MDRTMIFLFATRRPSFGADIGRPFGARCWYPIFGARRWYKEGPQGDDGHRVITARHIYSQPRSTI